MILFFFFFFVRGGMFVYVLLFVVLVVVCFLEGLLAGMCVHACLLQSLVHLLIYSFSATSVDTLFKNQSDLSELSGKPTFASHKIRECHTNDTWHSAPGSWLELVNTACQGEADGQPAITLCRPASEKAAGGASRWAYFIILCGQSLLFCSGLLVINQLAI